MTPPEDPRLAQPAPEAKKRRPTIQYTGAPLLTERSIINCLIWLAGLILGPYLAIAAVSGNFSPLIVVGAIAFTTAVFGIWKDRVCVLPLIGLFLGGKLTFLPLQLSPGEISSLALVFYYLVSYVALQRQQIKTGPMFFFIPILVFTAITFSHEHNFGLRALGGGREGSRGAILIMLAGITYLCGVSVNTPSASFFSRIPLICLAGVILTAVPYTISTFIPSTAPYLALFTTDINTTALSSILSDSSDTNIVRNSGPAYVGVFLMSYLASTFPIYTWWRPNRWWVAGLGMVCFALVILGGFRSTLFDFSIIVITCTWCYSSWRTLILAPPVLLAAAVLLQVQNSHLVSLPGAAQRTLSFLPGDWDAEATSEAESSNEFRQRIIDVYIREDAAKSPLFGNGLSYDSDEFARMNYLAKTQETADRYYETKIYVTGKIFHTGWISLYDAVGLVGSAAFCFLALSQIWILSRSIFGSGRDRSSPLLPLKVWLVANLVSSLIGYFAVFGDVKAAFPTYCYYAIIVHHLFRLEKFGHVKESVAEDLAFRGVSRQRPVLA